MALGLRKSARRRLLRGFHPDNNPDDPQAPAAPIITRAAGVEGIATQIAMVVDFQIKQARCQVVMITFSALDVAASPKV